MAQTVLQIVPRGITMKKKAAKKLGIQRESITTLTSDLLGGVAGGEARTLTWTCDPMQTHGNSQFLCMKPPVQ
jgi:hypothetical protein